MQRLQQTGSRQAACFDRVTHAPCSFMHQTPRDCKQHGAAPRPSGQAAHFERVYERLLQLLGLHLLGIWQRSKVGSHKAAHGFQSILLADQDIAVKSLLFLQDQWACQHEDVKACCHSPASCHPCGNRLQSRVLLAAGRQPKFMTWPPECDQDLELLRLPVGHSQTWLTSGIQQADSSCKLAPCGKQAGLLIDRCMCLHLLYPAACLQCHSQMGLCRTATGQS